MTTGRNVQFDVQKDSAQNDKEAKYVTYERSAHDTRKKHEKIFYTQI